MISSTLDDSESEQGLVGQKKVCSLVIRLELYAVGFAEYLFSFILCFVDVKESLVGVGLVSYDNKFKIAQLEKGTVLYLQV